MTRDSNRTSLKIVIVGHVDHGKSTLVGRLFHDTGSLPEGKLEAIKATCERRGMPFEWAFLMDALQAERDQGITIDTAQIRFRTKARDYVIIDAPGHREFLKNMVTGAASSEAALLLIDADEGVREQSRRHGYLLHLLGRRPGRGAGQQDGPGRLQRRSLRRRGRGVSRLSRAPGRRADVLHPDLGARGRQHRGAQQAHALVPGADHARRARPVQRRAPRRSTGRCASRSRTSTSSTSAASWPAGSSPAASRSATSCSSRPPTRPRRSGRSRPGTCRCRRRTPPPGSRSASPWTSRSSSSAARSRATRTTRRSRATCSGRICSGSATSRSSPATATP